MLVFRLFFVDFLFVFSTKNQHKINKKSRKKQRKSNKKIQAEGDYAADCVCRRNRLRLGFFWWFFVRFLLIFHRFFPEKTIKNQQQNSEKPTKKSEPTATTTTIALVVVVAFGSDFFLVFRRFFVGFLFVFLRKNQRKINKTSTKKQRKTDKKIQAEGDYYDDFVCRRSRLRLGFFCWLFARFLWIVSAVFQ